jgi:GDP-mannose 6-dehydrogenase
MLGGILASNRLHIEKALALVLATGKRRVGVVGLSFKTGTDDLRESPMVALAEQLIGKGLSLLVYDADVHLSRLLGANKRFIESHLPHIGKLIRADIGEVMDSSDVLVVAMSDAGILAQLRSALRKDHVVIDLVNVPEREAWPCAVAGLSW